MIEFGLEFRDLTRGDDGYAENDPVNKADNNGHQDKSSDKDDDKDDHPSSVISMVAVAASAIGRHAPEIGLATISLPQTVVVGALGMAINMYATNPVATGKCPCVANSAEGDDTGKAAPPANDKSGVGATPPDDPDSKEKAQKSLTPEDKRSIKTLEKNIQEHQAKLDQFKQNPTVRPGMENQPPEVIAKQQARRANKLQTEIHTFQKNIEKILSKYE